MFNIQAIRAWWDEHGFRETRASDGRRVHHTGFDDGGDELRQVRPGSDRGSILKDNAGVCGPVAMESSYVGRTTRVRLMNGPYLWAVWDVPDGADAEVWGRRFEIELDALLGRQARDRDAWWAADRTVYRTDSDDHCENV